MTRVAVIMGGWSSERPVSLSSGKGMADAARQSGFDVVEIDVTRQLAQQLADAKPDVVLNALHGPWGEDGCVQGILEIMGIPYTHSGVLASALAMDKDKARAIYVQHGLDVAHDLRQVEQWRRAPVLGEVAPVRGHPRRVAAQRDGPARQHAALDVDIVLEPDAQVAAQQEGLRQHRVLAAADAEGRPGAGLALGAS